MAYTLFCIYVSTNKIYEKKPCRAYVKVQILMPHFQRV